MKRSHTGKKTAGFILSAVMALSSIMPGFSVMAEETGMLPEDVYLHAEDTGEPITEDACCAGTDEYTVSDGTDGTGDAAGTGEDTPETYQGAFLEDTAEYADETYETEGGIVLPQEDPFEDGDVCDDVPVYDEGIIVDDSDAWEEETEMDALFNEEAQDQSIIEEPEETEAEETLESGEFEITVTVSPKSLPGSTPVGTLYESKEQCIDTSDYFDKQERCEASGNNADRLRGPGRYIYDTLESSCANDNLYNCFISFMDKPQWQYPGEVKAYAGYSLWDSSGQRHERSEMDKIILDENDKSVALLDTSDPDTDTYLYSIENMVKIPAYIFLLDHPDMFHDYTFSCTLKFSYTPLDTDMTVLAGLESAYIEYRPLVDGLTYSQACGRINTVCEDIYDQADLNHDGYVENAEYAMACYKYLRDNFVYSSEYASLNYEQAPLELLRCGTAVPVFFDGYGNKIVCSGYADAFSIMMKWYGIPCMTVGGWNHAFNYVKLNGRWYLVDATNKIFAHKKNEVSLGWYTTPMDGLLYPDLAEEGIGFEWSDRTEPTCTERGSVKTYSADNYDSMQPYSTQYLPATDHDWEITQTTATCNDPGTRTCTCRRCGKTETYDMGVLGHNWVETQTTGRCGEPRRSVFTCSMCGETWEKDTKGGDHRWKLTEDTACCEEDGVRKYVCEVCGETKEEASPATGHDYKTEATQEADCVKDGFIRSVCTKCGKVKEEVIPAHGHILRTVFVRKYATCTNGRLILHVCTRCGEHVNDEETAPLGHDYITKTILHPTCTDTGLAVRVCRHCGARESEEEIVLPARGHSYVVWREVPATCLSRAYTVYKCPVCAERKTEYHGDAPAGHDYREEITKQPTCTEKGVRTKICSKCGDRVLEEIPLKEHAWNEGTVTKQPSCTEEGEKLFTCTVCNATRTDTIPKTEHDLEEIEVIPPTCKAEGYTVCRCRKCHAEIKTAYTAKTGHQWTTKVITPATCTKDGRARQECAVCGVYQNETVLEHTGHTWIRDSVVEPTCLERGHTHYTCQNCGMTKDDDYKDALGHDLDNGTTRVISPTCTDRGYTVKTCRRCGEVIKTAETAPLGHSWKFVKKVPQTCRQGGYDLSRCSRCGMENQTNYTFVQGQGHHYVVTETKAPAVGRGGYTRRQCEYCGDVKMEYTNPLPQPTPPAPTPAPPAPVVVNPRISQTSAFIAKGTGLTLSVKDAKGAVSWSTSNKKTASVSSAGKVTAVNSGTCKITAKANGKTLTCTVKVIDPKLNKKSKKIKKKKTYKLKVKNAGGAPVTWKSSNTGIATVSGGTVKGVKKGSCKVYATVGGKTLTCKIKVK